MSVAVRNVFESLSAYGASVGLRTRVNPRMGPQIVPQKELFTTLITLEIPLFFVVTSDMNLRGRRSCSLVVKSMFGSLVKTHDVS